MQGIDLYVHITHKRGGLSSWELGACLRFLHFFTIERYKTIVGIHSRKRFLHSNAPWKVFLKV